MRAVDCTPCCVLDLHHKSIKEFLAIITRLYLPPATAYLFIDQSRVRALVEWTSLRDYVFSYDPEQDELSRTPNR